MKYPRRGRPQIRPETGTHKVFVQGLIIHLSFGSSKHSNERRAHYKGIPQWHFRFIFRTLVTDPETGEVQPSRMYLTMPMPFSNNEKAHFYTFIKNNNFPHSVDDPMSTIVGKMLSIDYQNLSNAGSWKFGSSKLITSEPIPSVFTNQCPTFVWDQERNSLEELPKILQDQLEDEIEHTTQEDKHEQDF